MNRKRVSILLSLCVALLAAGGLQGTQARNTQTIPPREQISVSKEVVEAWRNGRITTGDMAAALMAQFKAQREKDEHILNLFSELEKGNISVTALVAKVKEAMKQSTEARELQTIPPREPVTVSRKIVEAWKQGRITTGDMAAALMAHFRAQREKDEYILNLFTELEKGNISIAALVVHVKEVARGKVETMLHRDCGDFAGGVLIGCTLAGGPSETCIQAADAFYCLCLGGIYSEGGWCAIM